MHIHVYADPGHAWGKVSEAQLTRLGLTFGDFSNYSYRRGDFIYLEEDGDLTFFVEKHVEVLGKKPTWGEHTGNKESRIRNYFRNASGESYNARYAEFRRAKGLDGGDIASKAVNATA